MRKLIIGLTAMAFVVIVFIGYAIMMDTAPIELPSRADIQKPSSQESGDVSNQISDTDARSARDAKYFVLDPVTGEVNRIIGFKNLLNPGMKTSRWQVEKPFLVFYESNYRCRIDSDEGIFQVERSGPDMNVRDAQLNGNVVIHIIPQPGSRMSETTIKMDDLTFSSERSEFATDGPVNIESDQVELEGLGLTLIFDTATGRLDYLHIVDLELLRIFYTSESDAVAAEDSPQISDQPATVASNSTQSPSPGNTAAAKTSQDALESQTEPETASGYYRCILEDNVEIEYGDELVVTGADQVNIENILIQSMGENGISSSASTNASAPAPSPSVATSSAPVAAQAPEQVIDETVTTDRSEQLPQESAQTAQTDDSVTEVLVRCDGGIVLKPMQDEITDPVSETAKSASSEAKVKFKQDVAGAIPSEATHTAGDAISEAVSISNDPPPARFEAWNIDYDLLTGSGLAHGPVRLTFYQSPDSNNITNKPWIPVVITADDNTQFIPDESGTVEQVVFNKNVMVTRRAPKSEFIQLDKFHGNKLTVFLDENEEGDTDISDISMTDGKVYAQSQKLRAEEKLSNVKLSCAEINYNQADDEIIAKGPGDIQLHNSQVSDVDASTKNAGVDFSKPCYVLVEGFDSIYWDLIQEKIIADGQENQLEIAYVPLVKGKPEKYVYVDSIQFELSFMTNAAGKTELKRVFTDKSMKYTEKDRNKETLHMIIGQTLEYDTVDGNGWVKIEGTPAMPVIVDNVKMPFVYVHPNSGEVKAKLSTTPGVFKVDDKR